VPVAFLHLPLHVLQILPHVVVTLLPLIWSFGMRVLAFTLTSKGKECGCVFPSRSLGASCFFLLLPSFGLAYP